MQSHQQQKHSTHLDLVAVAVGDVDLKIVGLEVDHLELELDRVVHLAVARRVANELSRGLGSDINRQRGALNRDTLEQDLNLEGSNVATKIDHQGKSNITGREKQEKSTEA